MDNKKLSTKNPQLDSPGKISHFLDQGHLRFQILYWMPLNRKRTLWSSQTDCQDTAPLIGTRLTRTKDLCFSFFFFSYLFGTKHTHPHENKNGLLETQRSDLRQRAGGNPQFFWTIFPDKKNWAELKGGAKRTEKQNLARMARRKPILETLQKCLLRRSTEGISGNF